MNEKVNVNIGVILKLDPEDNILVFKQKIHDFADDNDARIIKFVMSSEKLFIRDHLTVGGDDNENNTP